MSRAFTLAIWEDDTIQNASERLLLLALADFADDDGVCWPSIATLARRACISTGHTRRLITRLIADGRIIAERRGGARVTSRYRLTLQNTRTHARVDDDETRAPMRAFDEKRAHPRAETRAPTRADPPMILEKGGLGGKDFNNGGEGETGTAALQVDAAPRAGLDEVIAAWDVERWPLTPPLRKGLENDCRTYSASEVLTAIEIMQSTRKEIQRPGAYLKTVLRRRASALVDTAVKASQAAAAEPQEPAQVLFEQAREIMSPLTAAALAGARCTNGDGFTVHIPAEQAASIPLIELKKREIRDALRKVSRTNAELRVVTEPKPN